MAAILYTTTEKIRASLGSSEPEISDLQVTDASVEDQLTIDLEGVYPDHAALAAAQAGSPSSEEKRLFIILQLYCQFAGACCLLPQLQLLVAQKITDSDVEMQRFMKDDLQKLKDEIIAKRDQYAALLQAAADISTAAGTPFIPIGTASPNFDPVTNEGAA